MTSRRVLASSLSFLLAACASTSSAACASTSSAAPNATSGESAPLPAVVTPIVAPPPARAAREATASEGRTSEPLPEDPLTRERIAANCPDGRPIVEPDAARATPLGTLRIVTREGYALVHASALRVPLFVCEHVEPIELAGSLHGHRPDWHGDPMLPANERAEDDDYRGSGYDRGHMAPVGDQTSDADARRDTFFFSNAIPQDHTLNERDWNALEQEVRALLRTRGGGYVITGPIFERGQPVATIGARRVAVPTHVYKIVVVEGSDVPETYAFVYENRTYATREPSAAHLTSIDHVESLTGLDFLPALDDATEATVEAQVARRFPP